MPRFSLYITKHIEIHTEMHMIHLLVDTHTHIYIYIYIYPFLLHTLQHVSMFTLYTLIFDINMYIDINMFI